MRPPLPDDPGIAGVGGSSRDKVGSVQYCRMGRAR